MIRDSATGFQYWSAFSWTTRTMEVRRCRHGNIPGPLAALTVHFAAPGGGDRASLDLKGFSVNESIGNGLVRVPQDPPECRP